MPTAQPAATKFPVTEQRQQSRVWVLLGSKAGDNAQVSSLADALAWPYETKQLFFNNLRHLPPLLLDATLVSVDLAKSDPLAPPWPDVVISAGKRSVAAARWIQAQSGGHARLVHIGRPWAPLEWFDLIITTPQYGLPARPNVLHNTMPLNRVTPDRLARGATDPEWQARVRSLPRPRIAVLVGGSSSSHVMTTTCASALGREASRRATNAAGSLMVVASPRTPSAALEALRAAITVPALIQAFGDSPRNAYDAFLALADAFVVTGDSASMLAEACSTGKPVHIFALPHRYELVPGARFLVRLVSSLLGGRTTYRGTPKQQDALARAYDRLVERGFITPPRDIDRYHAALEARGLASRTEEPVERASSPGPDDLERAVAGVRRLLARARRIAT